MASVDGLAYRALWSRLETSAGVYNWSSLDEIADAPKWTTRCATSSGEMYVAVGTTWDLLNRSTT